MASKVEMLAKELVRFGRQAKQGATFGFADELQDILAAVPAAAFTDMTYSEALKMARELSKEQLSTDWKEAPAVSIAGQVAGGIPLGFSKAGQAATNWIRGGSALSGIGKGVATGAGFTGTAAMGAADDNVWDRLAAFGFGAATGGLVGGLTAPLARIGMGGIDYRNVVKKISGQFSNKAEQELARQLSARPDLPQQLTRAEEMAAAAQRTGIPLTLPEIVAQSSSDPLLAQQAVLGTNPMTAGQMAQMYAARSGTPQQTGQIEQSLMRLAQQLDPSVGSYDEAARALIDAGDKAQGRITSQLVSQARPLYDQAYQMNVGADDAILQNPLIRSVLDSVRKNPVYAQEIGNAADNSIQALDAVKRALDDMAEAANRAGNRNEARLIQNARTQLLETMKAASPEYGQALSVYSGNPDALQMREIIGAIADIDPMDARSVNRALFGGTQQNADMAARALGQKAPTAAAARIYDAMDAARGDPTTLATKIAPDQRTADMLRTYAGGNQLDETLNVINKAKLGERMRYGSPTQPRLQAETGLDQAANAAIDVATGGKTTLLRRVWGMLGGGDKEPDPQFYADMADLMLTDKGMDLLRRVAAGQQTAIQQLKPGMLSTSIGGTTRATTTAPIARAGISGVISAQQDDGLAGQQMRTPEYNKPLIPQPQAQTTGFALPPGFSLQDDLNKKLALPPGFVIME